MNNLVAKHARTYNKSHVFRDRTKFQRSNQINLAEWFGDSEDDWLIIEEEDWFIDEKR